VTVIHRRLPTDAEIEAASLEVFGRTLPEVLMPPFCLSAYHATDTVHALIAYILTENDRRK
jgi:hypothetical protein